MTAINVFKFRWFQVYSYHKLQHGLTQRFLMDDAVKENNILAGVSSFTYYWILLSSPTFFPVKFSDPSMVTLASFLQSRFILSMTVDT